MVWIGVYASVRIVVVVVMLVLEVVMIDACVVVLTFGLYG